MVRGLAGCLLLAFVVASQPSCTSSDSTSASETPIAVKSSVQFDPDDPDVPVATFKFEQFEDARITLKIESLIDADDHDSVSFSYTVDFLPREVSDESMPWQNEGAVTDLPPQVTVDQGVIATSTAPIDQGRLTIEFTSGPNYD